MAAQGAVPRSARVPVRRASSDCSIATAESVALLSNVAVIRAFSRR